MLIRLLRNILLKFSKLICGTINLPSKYWFKCAYSTEKNPFFGIRHVQAILCFLLLAIGYAMRVNLSVGIVAMNTKTSDNPDIPVYDWKDQSIVLSSFFWGYIVLQLPAGHFGNIYGPKWFLVVAMTINSMACMLTPIMSDSFGSKGAIICRVTQGLSQGFFFPSVHNLLSKWVPPAERSRLTNLAYTGASFGTIVAMPITGLISSSWAGWPASFYVFGSIGICWVVVWIIVGANSPEEHKYISQKEKYLIQSSLGQQGEQVVPPTPWKKIFTSLPVWAIIVANFGQNWGYSILLTEIPTYLSGYMGFDMKDNAMLSAAPYLAATILGFVFGPISDYIINTKIVTRGTSRKIFHSIGVVVPAISLTILGFVSEDQTVLCISLLIIAVGVNSALLCGYQVNHIDLTPVYAGTLMGLANGPANSFSIIGPLVVQFIVGENTDDQVLWREVFLTAAASYIISAVFYVIFAKGEIQPWNYEEKEGHKDDSRDKSKTNETLVVVIENPKY